MLPKSNAVSCELARNCEGLIWCKVPIWSHRTLWAHVYAFIIALDTLSIYYELLLVILNRPLAHKDKIIY